MKICRIPEHRNHQAWSHRRQAYMCTRCKEPHYATVYGGKAR